MLLAIVAEADTYDAKFGIFSVFWRMLLNSYRLKTNTL